MIFRRFLSVPVIVVVSVLCIMHSSHADEGLGLDAKIGTMGVGGEVSAALFPNTRIRGGFNFLTWTFESTISGIDYDFETEFNSIPVILDLHPFGGSFFISGGVYFNNNSVSVDGFIGPEDFTPAYQAYDFLANQVSLSGDVEFNPLAPYLGFGWRTNSGASGWGFGLELGVLYQGAPDITNLRINAPVDISTTESVRQFLAEQAREIEDELSWFEFYPVASVMFTYHF
ncbi:MAG: hypothetical protein LJE64_07545 [Desulfofustis sp.]|nr:hypothetical protein [Desulfofustis sp.]